MTSDEKRATDSKRPKTNDNRPKVGVGVYIVRQGTILLGKRHGSHGTNTYSAPGGHLEFGETWQQCATREVEEETGLKINNVRYLGLTNDIFKTESKHYITIAMLADYDSGEAELREPDKCLGWRWYGLDSLPKNLFLPCENLLKSQFADELKRVLEKSKEEN
jgi:8-oxo-dGTP diphosphatase